MKYNTDDNNELLNQAMDDSDALIKEYKGNGIDSILMNLSILSNQNSRETHTGTSSSLSHPSPVAGKSIYLAGGWFSEKQVEMLTIVSHLLGKNPTVGNTHIPLLNQYKTMNEDMGTPEGYEWANETFNADVTAMNLADIGVFLWDKEEPDSGTAMELGYMYANHKPIVLVGPKEYDLDYKKNKLNLMIAKGLTVYVDSYKDLLEFDFNEIMPDPYKGKVI